MRSDTEKKLTAIWYSDQAVPIGLRLAEPLYRIGSRLDRWWKTRRRPDGLDGAYVIVVGNLTVGGSGKTPLVIRLCRLLKAAGFNPGVISRGYGRLSLIHISEPTRPSP